MNNRRNILVVTCVFPPEPVVSANISFDIANELSKTHNVTVISPYPSRPNGMQFLNIYNLHYPFTHIRLGSYISKRSKLYSRLRESHSFGLLSSRYIKQNYKSIDLIYMNTWPLLAQFYTIHTARKYSIPVITHIQDIYPESLSQKFSSFGTLINILLLPIDKFITKNSTALITISQSMNSLLVRSRNISNKNISVVYNWQDESLFNVCLNNSYNKSEYFTFMYVGSLNILANIESLIVAFRDAHLIKCRFVIAGEGPEKQKLISFVKNNNIANIKFLSFDPKDIGLLQSTSDVLVLSLKKGGSSLAFPSKIPAYMFSSRPIMAYVDASSDVAQAIENANCGWIIPSGDIDKLKNSFIQISKIDKSVLKDMGEKGNRYALMQFSRSSNLNKILSIIQDKLRTV